MPITRHRGSDKIRHRLEHGFTRAKYKIGSFFKRSELIHVLTF
ncbi:MAG: hypothetical protein AB7U98_11645 [Candidatus Nitrosocosmicus sp.]